MDVTLFRIIMIITDIQELKELLPNPKEIVSQLDEYIIGQNDSKKTLALMLLNRGILKLRRAGKITLDTEIEKSNVLLIGDTGCGKTALMKALSKVADIPISIYDVTDITEAGYIGGKVEDILINHVDGCYQYVYGNYERLKLEFGLDEYYTPEHLMLEIAETGIIYIDEIDKIAHSNLSASNRNTNRVQDELLKIIESGIINLGGSGWHKKKSNPGGLNELKTDDIIFVGGGAFSGLDEIIKKRLVVNNIGFTNEIKGKEDLKDIVKNVTSEDLIEYGLKPEFLGRLPLRSILSPLDIDTLIQIITVPKNCILEQYKSIFNLLGVNLYMSQEALKTIAKKAQDMKMGARSLKTLFNKLFINDLYNIWELSGQDLIITKLDVEERCE